MALSVRNPGAFASLLISRLRKHAPPRPRLVLLERITIAPRQSLALVEADGRHFLIATSAEGAPAFHALDQRAARHGHTSSQTRISW